MPVLDAAFAFALTMLVVATAVTQIVRFLQHTAKLRSAELQKMLKEYFSKEFQPVVQRELSRVKKKIKTKETSAVIASAEGLVQAGLFDQNELKALVDVSTEELKERLKRSSFGQELLKKLGDEAKAVFDELGRRYEIVGDKFTESFRNHARKWATGIALVLALAVNIDSIFILRSYIGDENMRQQVIAQRDAFVGDYTALKDTLEKEKDKKLITREEFEQAFSDSQKQLNKLATAGFPIGWSYFPHAGLLHERGGDYELRNTRWGWALWLAGIVLTAALAGRGAPFWYDMLTGISRVTQKARAIRKPAE